MERCRQQAAPIGTGHGPDSRGSRQGTGVVVVVADAVGRRRSRQAVSRPKVVQFSLTEEEFAEVSEAAARSGLPAAHSPPGRRWPPSAAPGRAPGRHCGRRWWS